MQFGVYILYMHFPVTYYPRARKTLQCLHKEEQLRVDDRVFLDKVRHIPVVIIYFSDTSEVSYIIQILVPIFALDETK